LRQKSKRNFSRQVHESSSTLKKLDERLEKVQKRESDFVAANIEFVEDRKNKELDHFES